MYKSILKPILFRFAPERAHYITVGLLKFATAIPGGKAILSSLYHPQRTQKKELWGLTFENPVGLAAGFDKDGKYYNAMSALGFGFIELGTVTPRPQPGNPTPRLFRLPADKALINRMGFNNDGVDALAKRLATQPKPKGMIIGGNIGKNKDTANEDALHDYMYCFESLHPYVDYFVVNVSSPNTPGLRDLQEKGPLLAILTALQQKNQALEHPRPLLLKIAPDLTDTQLDDIVDIARQANLAGVIATNTTISRANLHTSDEEILAIGNGGLSGSPLTERSTAVVRYLCQRLEGIPVIAVGGIATAKDAKEKLDAGAALVQVYTGLIYEGPAIVRRICDGLF